MLLADYITKEFNIQKFRKNYENNLGKHRKTILQKNIQDHRQTFRSAQVFVFGT